MKRKNAYGGAQLKDKEYYEEENAYEGVQLATIINFCAMSKKKNTCLHSLLLSDPYYYYYYCEFPQFLSF